ncbi:MAG: ribonuclease Z [Rikenellaceae bacterium]|jgi:ribonuclease Z|nr:ribonuclease Z [Rikenellaceae bacterium]
MRFEVTILGSSSASPTAGRHHSAHVLNVREQFYLVDCGEGTQSRLMRAGVSPLKINAIFITHTHGDHIYGLAPLISSLGLAGKKIPLKIFGPAELGRMIDFYQNDFGHPVDFEIQFTAVDTTKNQLIFENKSLEVWTIPLRHRVPTTGYLFREKQGEPNVRKELIERYGLGIAQIVAVKRGEDITLEDGRTVPAAELTYFANRPRSYAYCSDTLSSGKVAGIVSGVDLLYHEATFADSDRHLAKETGHSTATGAAKIASKAGVGRLIIGHFSSRYKELAPLEEEARAVFPESHLAIEGKTFAIPLKTND